MKTKFINWLLYLLQPKFTDEQIRRIDFTKSIFKTYFDGCYGVDPIAKTITTLNLGITNIEFKFNKDLLVMTITLLRPGLLIGRHGETIDKLSEYLSNGKKPVKIHIIESKLWNRIKNKINVKHTKQISSINI